MEKLNDYATNNSPYLQPHDGDGFRGKYLGYGYGSFYNDPTCDYGRSIHE